MYSETKIGYKLLMYSSSVFEVFASFFFRNRYFAFFTLSGEINNTSDISSLDEQTFSAKLLF